MTHGDVAAHKALMKVMCCSCDSTTSFVHGMAVGVLLVVMTVFVTWHTFENTRKPYGYPERNSSEVSCRDVDEHPH